jgi:hypothetical protein
MLVRGLVEANEGSATTRAYRPNQLIAQHRSPSYSKAVWELPQV